MYKLQVAANKLNIRNTPDADPEYKNWVGELLKGEEFLAESIVKGGLYNGIDLWYKDNYNRFATLSELGDNDPKIPWSLRILGVPHVWNITKGEGVKVAIIDSGIDMKNPDLKSAVVSGFNILTNTEYLLDQNDECLQSSFSHGNYCASILASRGNIGFFGVAPMCELVIIKIANNRNDYNISNEFLGIKKAIELGAEIISLSFGGATQNFDISSLLQDAIQRGIICIASAGDFKNALNVEYPANLKGMISIGNVTCLNPSASLGQAIFNISDKSNGQIPSSSNEGVTIVAPGEGITVYDLQQQVRQLVSGFGGTSWSVPYVSGIAAIWLSIIKRRNPSINNHLNFRDFVISNADKNFKDYNVKYWGNGLINPISLIQINS
ncbi:MAG: S8 family serine peptidase [Agriterribacter sp.]